MLRGRTKRSAVGRKTLEIRRPYGLMAGLANIVRGESVLSGENCHTAKETAHHMVAETNSKCSLIALHVDTLRSRRNRSFSASIQGSG